MVYFVELRRIIPVNYIGAEIIRCFFNYNRTIGEIQQFLVENGYELKQENIEGFLRELKSVLKKPYEGGYPVIEEEQMEAPLAVELQVNTTCNLKCKHCCQADYGQVMPLEKIKFILKELYKKNIFEITLVGGELLLHPNLHEVIELCCGKYNFATTIVTNGTLLSSSLIESISRHKDTLAFLISIEGVGKINDDIRGEGVFRKVDRSLKKLKREGFYVEISATVNSFTINYYQDLIEYAQSLEIPLNFNLFKPFKGVQDDLILPPDRYFIFVNEVFRKRLSEKLNIGLTNAAITAEMLNQPERNECKATLSGLTVDVNGKMIPCAFLSEIGYYKESEMPSFDKNFVKSWQSNNYFKKFRRGNLKECQACSYIFTGDTSGESPYGIEAFRRHVRNSY